MESLPILHGDGLHVGLQYGQSHEEGRGHNNKRKLQFRIQLRLHIEAKLLSVLKLIKGRHIEPRSI